MHTVSEEVPDPGFERVATLDIETTGLSAARAETVSIGVGVHEVGAPAGETDHATFHRDGSGEAAVIRRGLEHVADSGADALLTFNGRSFDLPFLRKRLDRLGADCVLPSLCGEGHVDLCRDDLAPDVSGPLEDRLQELGFEPARTEWRGRVVDGGRFGTELGPAYLEAVRRGDGRRREALQPVIDHYLVTDLEANLAVYHAGIGRRFEPALLGSSRSF